MVKKLIMRELLQRMKIKKITKKFEKFLDSLSDKERIDLMQGSGDLKSTLSGAGKNRNVILSNAPEFSRNPGKVDPDILDTMFNKGGSVKKRVKKKKARTGMKVRGTKFKGIF